MRKHNKLSTKVLGLLIVLIFSIGTAQAQDFGARAYGMGGAFTGIANELPSMIYNPARLSDSAFQVGVGLGATDLQEISSFHEFLDDPSQFKESARLGLVSLSGVSIAGIGAGFAADGTLSVNAGCPQGLCADGEYMTQILLSMGRKSVSLPIVGLNVGGTVKRLDGRRIYYENNLRLASEHTPYYETMIDKRGEGYSLTLGATMGLTKMITVGVAATDVISTLTWTGTETKTSYTWNPAENDFVVDDETVTDLAKESEKLETVYRAGVSVKPPVLGLTLAGDIASDGTLRYGVEKNLFFNLLSLRAGQIHVDNTTTTTFGLGISLGPAHLDAAVGSDDGFDTYTSMVEASVRF